MAHQAIQKAVDLSGHASPAEQAYIQAMALRFPADPKADRKQAAEAYRDRHARGSTEVSRCFGCGHPIRRVAEEIVATLESVIKRDPNRLGAVHYYIHAVEASASPERALAAADKLAAMAPAAGHLVHMPAHVYIRTGDYESAVKTDQQAAAVDRAYIKSSGAQGLYPMMYYSQPTFHCHLFRHEWELRGGQKKCRYAGRSCRSACKDMAPIEGFTTIPMAVDIRFHRWSDILRSPQPDPAMKVATVFWHFARGMAQASTGKLSEAEREYNIIADAEKNTPEDAIFAMPINNKTKDILKIAREVLGAKIAMAKKDSSEAIAMLTDAVAVQDSLKYGEPPDWFFRCASRWAPPC